MSTNQLPGNVVIDVSELDALPEGAIVRASNGHAYEKSMKWTLTGRRWLEAGNSSPERPDDIPLPATLLYPTYS